MARHGRGKGEFGVFSAGELCQEAPELDVQVGEEALATFVNKIFYVHCADDFPSPSIIMDD
jgi:hypothetical protein